MRKLTWLIPIVVVLVTILFGINYLRTRPEVIETDVFINGGSLGGSSAAIQLSTLETKFILIEETDWLGGQAASQGVSTFDQNGRKFQESSVYAQIIDASELDGGKSFLGNATTGPGMPAKLVNDTINKLINPEFGKIFTGAKFVRTNKSGNRIDSIEFTDRTGKLYQVKAKVFLDAADFSEMSQAAGEDMDLGLESATGEYGGFNANEFKQFTEGDKANGLTGFGNRMQPFTSTLAIIDSVFTGYTYSTGPTKDCNGESCTELTIANTLELEIKPPQNGNFDLLVLADKNSDLAVTSASTPFAQKVHTVGGYKIYQVPFYVSDKTNETLSIKNNGQESTSLYKVILNPTNVRQQTTATFDAIELLATKVIDDKQAVKTSNWNDSNAIRPFVGSGYVFTDTKGATITFNIAGDQFDSNQVFYLLTSYTQANKRGKMKVTFKQNNKQTFSTIIDQSQAILPGASPIIKTRFNPESNYSVTLESLGGGTITADSILILNEKAIGTFDFVEFTRPYSVPADGLYDIFVVSDTIKEISLKINTTDAEVNKNQIEQQGIYHLKRTFLNKGDGIEANINGSGYVVIKALNLNHYANYRISNFSSNNKYSLEYLAPGFYDVYLNTKAGDTQLTTRISNPAGELLNNSTSVKTGFNRLGTIKSNGYKMVEIEVSGNCADCKPEVILTEAIPTSFNLLAANHDFQNYSSFKSLLSNKPANGLFHFRQVLDAINFNETTTPLIGIAELNFIQQLSLGATYINIPQNDYAASIDLEKFKTDVTYREEQYKLAEQLSYELYYWLKYESSPASWNCPAEQALFCSALRINWLPDAMGSNDGFSQLPYIREVPRPKAKLNQDFNSISLLANQCKEAEIDCQEFKFGDKTIRVKQDFLNNSGKHPVAVFYYPTDIHKLTNEAEQEQLDQFNRTLLQSSRKNTGSDFLFWNGIFESEIKPGTVELEQLMSQSADNLFFCAKNIGVSQVLNGSTRLHPAESAIGQACGSIATYMIRNSVTADNLTDDATYSDLAKFLVNNGQYIAYLDDVKILENFKNGQMSTNEAIFKSVLEGIIQADIVQNPSIRFLVYQYLPDKAVQKDEFNRFAKKFSFTPPDLTLSDKVTFADLESTTGSKYDSVHSKILNSYCFGEDQPDFCTSQQIPPSKILARQDLAVASLTLTDN